MITLKQTIFKIVFINSEVFWNQNPCVCVSHLFRKLHLICSVEAHLRRHPLPPFFVAGFFLCFLDGGVTGFLGLGYCSGHNIKLNKILVLLVPITKLGGLFCSNLHHPPPQFAPPWGIEIEFEGGINCQICCGIDSFGLSCWFGRLLGGLLGVIWIIVWVRIIVRVGVRIHCSQ